MSSDEPRMTPEPFHHVMQSSLSAIRSVRPLDVEVIRHGFLDSAKPYTDRVWTEKGRDKDQVATPTRGTTISRFRSKDQRCDNRQSRECYGLGPDRKEASIWIPVVGVRPLHDVMCPQTDNRLWQWKGEPNTVVAEHHDPRVLRQRTNRQSHGKRDWGASFCTPNTWQMMVREERACSRPQQQRAGYGIRRHHSARVSLLAPAGRTAPCPPLLNSLIHNATL